MEGPQPVITVPLGGKTAAGRHTLVDDEQTWVFSHGWSINGRGYVQAKIKGRVVLLHRLLLPTDPGVFVDHINRDPLDNRLENLRPLTRSASPQNVGPHCDGSSRFRGVYWRNADRKWCAQGSRGTGKAIYLGLFATEEQAAAVAAAWRAEHMPYATN